MRTNPIQFTGRLPSPRKARISNPAPRIPATQPPGIRISNSTRTPPARYQYEHQRRVGEEAENPLNRRLLRPSDTQVPGFQSDRAPLHRHLHSVQLVQQVGNIGGEQVKNVQLQRLAFRVGSGFGYGLLQRLGIPVALIGDTSQKGGGVCVALALMVSGSSSPPAATGDAAPIFVPGDIAATCAAATRNVPADAALEPDGVTSTATGTGESRMSPTISRMDSRSPPGVSSSRTNSSARLS